MITYIIPKIYGRELSKLLTSTPSHIIPVYKAGSQTQLGNNRSISLLSIMFKKILEKLMYKRLMKFLEKNEVLFNKQFDFRSGYPTEHAVLCIIDKI